MQKKTSGLGRGLGALLAPHLAPNEENELVKAQNDTEPQEDGFDEKPKKQNYTEHLAGVARKFPTPAEIADRAGQHVEELPLALLRPMKDQPRQSFHDDTLEELAASIRTYGILQPIIATAHPESGYTIIAGERRFRAASLAGLLKVPVIVRGLSEHTDLELALIENIQREELNPVDEARALHRLVQEHNYSQETLASRIGKDRATVSNMLRILSLPDEILGDLKDRKMSAGHAKALCALDGKKLQLKVRELVFSKKLSVRQTEDLVKNLKKGKAEPKVLKDHLPPDLRHLCEELKSNLQMKVRISGASDKGKIEIEYFSLDDLERLSKILLGDPFANTRLPNS
ncbi:MAG: ParB/RepB/Spo0J family partition protein [Silvanigrellales bacterium]|nr:ParB/RepB/Spo0J family partition protein [Silvanigrellales bacterium]